MEREESLVKSRAAAACLERQDLMSWRENEARHGMISEHSPEVIVTFWADADEVSYVNTSACVFWDRPPNELLGSGFFCLFPDEEDGERIKSHIDTLTPEHPAETYECQLIAESGQRRFVQRTVMARFDDLGEAVEYGFKEVDTSKANIDDLTDLVNRQGFLTLAEQELKRADRTRAKILLLFADFDRLKWINDSFGHREGDQALIAATKVLKETFRESDIVARIAGDEFVVLAFETEESVVGEDGGVEVREDPAEIFRTRLEESLAKHNEEARMAVRKYDVGISVGIAVYDPENPCSIDELLARADRAMYEKKQALEAGEDD